MQTKCIWEEGGILVNICFNHPRPNFVPQIVQRLEYTRNLADVEQEYQWVDLQNTSLIIIVVIPFDLISILTTS